METVVKNPVDLQYDDAVLAQLQSIELAMLESFARICEKYQIEYFCTYGTAIGALRHKGFIPWDDDIDIGMLRSEYEKLRKVPREEWGDSLLLADARDECPFHRTLFPRLYKLGTGYETELYYKYLKPRSGQLYPIYIDVFLFDEIGEKTNIRFWHMVANMYKRAILCAACDRRIYRDDPIGTKVSSAIKKCIGVWYSFQKNARQRLYSRYQKAMSRIKPGGYVTCFEVVRTMDQFSRMDEMFPTVKADFEGMTIRLQKNYDAILRKHYGEYMLLPPESKRHNPIPRVLDFGDGRGNLVEQLWQEPHT